jgi:hypothetical protein
MFCIPLLLARSDFEHMDYKGFYTIVLECNDSIISVASIRYHVKIILVLFNRTFLRGFNRTSISV